MTTSDSRILRLRIAVAGDYGVAPLNGDGDSGVLLRLYVAGNDARSFEARRLCEQVASRCRPVPCRLEIVDVLEDPRQAEQDQVLATPMLVRLDPPPLVRLIGGLWNAEFVMEALQLNSTNEHPA